GIAAAILDLARDQAGGDLLIASDRGFPEYRGDAAGDRVRDRRRVPLGVDGRALLDTDIGVAALLEPRLEAVAALVICRLGEGRVLLHDDLLAKDAQLLLGRAEVDGDQAHGD